MNYSNISLKQLMYLLEINDNIISKQNFNDLQHNKILRYYSHDKDEDNNYILYLRNNILIKIIVK